MICVSVTMFTLGACTAAKRVSRVGPQHAITHEPYAASGPLSEAQNRHARELALLAPIFPPKGPYPPIERSGRAEQGGASYYAQQFGGRTMANGRKFDPLSNAAASKTLPLGTTAKVINRENGKSANVTIQDHGPFIDGRIIDVSPEIARELQMKKKGVVPVEVKPITVPQPNGEVTLGAGAAGEPREEIESAVQTTKDLSRD